MHVFGISYDNYKLVVRKGKLYATLLYNFILKDFLQLFNRELHNFYMLV